MAISPSMFTYLLAASRAGVDFSRMATIGKQDYKTTRHDLPPICRAFGLTEKPEHIADRCRRDVDQFYAMLGAERVDSIDASDFEGATILHDMNRPIPPDLHERFTAVVDIGCVEHIFNFPQAIHNYMEMVAIGGHLIVITCANNLLGHGLYQFSPDLFYRVLSPANGYRVLGLHLCMPYYHPPRYFAVQDPATIRNRTELTNDQPVDIMVVARRERAASIFEPPPQQSDYTAAWAGQARQPLPPPRQRRHPRPRPSLKRRAKSLARRVVGPGLKVGLQRRLGLSYAPDHGWEQACFQPVPLGEMAAGGVIEPAGASASSAGGAAAATRASTTAAGADRESPAATRARDV